MFAKSEKPTLPKLYAREMHITIDSKTRESVRRVVSDYNYHADYYEKAQSIMQELQGKFSYILPLNLIQTLTAMASGVGPDVLSVSNLPVDSILPQDENLVERVNNKTRISEGAILGLASYLNGTLQTEDSSHQKGLIQQIFPVKKHSEEASGRGTAPLPFHVENVFVKASPSFLCLYCVKGEANVETEYLFVDDVIKYLDEATIEQLKRPIYSIRSGDGFSKKSLDNNPVLDEVGAGWIISRFYEEDRIFANDTQGKQAVEQLHDAIVKARDNDLRSVVLKPGTALIISNGVGRGHPAGVMHGRKGNISISDINTESKAHQLDRKKPKSNEVPRWLQRLCIEISYV